MIARLTYKKIGTQCVHVSAIWKLLLDMLFCLTLYKMLASLVLYGVMFVSQLEKSMRLLEKN